MAIDSTFAIATETNALYSHPDGSVYTAGAVHVFDIRTGYHLFRLRNPTPHDSHDLFGDALDADHSTLVVGDPNSMDLCPGPSTCPSRAAFVFDLTTGQQRARLIPDVPIPNDGFAATVAIDGQMAIAGGATGWHRAVSLFDASSGDELFRLSPMEREGVWMDVDVATSDGRAIIGAADANTVLRE